MQEIEEAPLSAAEKKRQLFLEQKKTLGLFLERRAISREQYEKSFGDLMRKMGFDEDGNADGGSSAE